MIELLVEKWIAVAFIIVAICVIRMLGRGRIRSGVIYALWGVLVLRLLWPAALTLPESRYSIQNWHVSQKISQEISQEISDDDFWEMGQNNVVQSEQNAVAQDGQNAMVQNGQNAVVQIGQSAVVQNGQNTELQAGQNPIGQQQGSQRPEQSSQSGQLMQEQVQHENQYVQEPFQRFSLFVSVPAWLWIWASGTILFGIITAVSQVRFLRRLKRERVFWKSADQLTDLVDTPIPVYLWEGSTSPFLYGVFHPAIYLPEALTEEEKVFEYALLHEWCHYRHGDHVWALIRVICLALYWHHPLVWVAASLSRSDCELACDDSVRVCLGEKKRLAYAGSLLSILEAEVQRERFGYMTTSMSGDGREIARRMKLLWDKRPGRILTVVVACVALVGMGCAAFTTTSPTGQDGKESVAEPIPAEPGQELYEGIYYLAEIDKIEDIVRIDEISETVQWYDRLIVDGSGEIHGWKRSDLTALYYVQCQWQLSESGDGLVEVVPADGWYLYGGEGPIDESTPYLRGNLMLYAQPDHAADVIILQTEAERGSAQEAQQTIRLIRTDNEHWIQVEAWNGTTGWVYMEVPGILRVQGKLYAWDNFVVGPVATKDTLISTVHREMSEQEEEEWIKHIFEKEAITVEIGKDGIQLLTDVVYQADLNEDGILEQFCYLGVDSENNSPHFVINGRKYYMDPGYGTGNDLVHFSQAATPNRPTGIYVKYFGDAGRKQETYYLCNIRSGDGQTEFGLGHWHGQRRKTSFLAYDGEDMNYIGAVDNIPIASADQYAFGVQSRELEQENLSNGTWGFDGAGHIGLSMPMSLLQQNWYANVVWELDEATNQLRLLPPEDGLYEISDPWYYAEASLFEDGVVEYPHLIQDLVVYAEPDLQSRTRVFSAEDHGADNKIYFTHTDNEHWIRIVDDAGATGWFYMEDFDTIRTEEGEVSTFEVFGWLNMAG